MPTTELASAAVALAPETNIDVHHELTSGFAASYIRKKARLLSRQSGFSVTDEDDLSQQIFLKVLERIPQFDPNQGCFNHFVKLVVNQLATDCRRRNRAERRIYEDDPSLESLRSDEEDTSEKGESRVRSFHDERPDCERFEIAEDVASALANLPRPLRDLAERLKDASPSQVARDLGIHRSTIYVKIRQLRDELKRANCHEYLKSTRQLDAEKRSSINRGTLQCNVQTSEPSAPTPAMPSCCQPVASCKMNGAAHPAKPDATSFIIHEPAAIYHARAGEYLTSHLLADFRRCPLLYHRKRQGLVAEREERPAYLVGRAAHTVILEGEDAFHQQFAVGGPVNPQTGLPYGTGTKAYAQWAEAQGKDVLTEQQHALVRSMARSVASHPEAAPLLAAGTPEGVVRHSYRGQACQVRMDWFEPHTGIVDLKTCDDLTWFEADARRYSYVHQLAFYQAVLAQVIGIYVPVY